MTRSALRRGLALVLAALPLAVAATPSRAQEQGAAPSTQWGRDDAEAYVALITAGDLRGADAELQKLIVARDKLLSPRDHRIYGSNKYQHVQVLLYYATAWGARQVLTLESTGRLPAGTSAAAHRQLEESLQAFSTAVARCHIPLRPYSYSASLPLALPPLSDADALKIAALPGSSADPTDPSLLEQASWAGLYRAVEAAAYGETTRSPSALNAELAQARWIYRAPMLEWLALSSAELAGWSEEPLAAELRLHALRFDDAISGTYWPAEPVVAHTRQRLGLPDDAAEAEAEAQANPGPLLTEARRALLKDGRHAPLEGLREVAAGNEGQRNAEEALILLTLVANAEMAAAAAVLSKFGSVEPSFRDEYAARLEQAQRDFIDAAGRHLDLVSNGGSLRTLRFEVQSDNPFWYDKDSGPERRPDQPPVPLPPPPSPQRRPPSPPPPPPATPEYELRLNQSMEGTYSNAWESAFQSALGELVWTRTASGWHNWKNFHAPLATGVSFHQQHYASWLVQAAAVEAREPSIALDLQRIRERATELAAPPPPPESSAKPMAEAKR